MSRATAALLLLLPALVIPSGSVASDVSIQALARQRALEAYSLMLRYYYVPARATFDGTYPPSGVGYAQLWPYTQAFSATLEIARLTGRSDAINAVRGGVAGLSAFRAPLVGRLAYAPLRGGKGNPFYDDNNWAGIALVNAADLLHDNAELRVAERLFAWIRGGWDTRADACRGGVYWLMPGGTYWTRSPGSRYRTAVSTLNGALLAMLLYQRTHVISDLRWAAKAYDWTQRCLSTTEGLIEDHIDTSGNVTTSVYSYNQGAAIATAVDLYRVTRNSRYLADAVRTADVSLAAFRDPLSASDNVSMLAIFYSDLLTLAPFTRGAAIKAAITSFSNQSWIRNRNPTTGLFQFGETYATLLDQAAMVQVYAELARS